MTYYILMIISISLGLIGVAKILKKPNVTDKEKKLAYFAAACIVAGLIIVTIALIRKVII